MGSGQVINRTFAVIYKGRNTTDDQMHSFMQSYLGITQFSCNFSYQIVHKKGEALCLVETTLYTEAELDAHSMDYEFIQL
jgi:hypothetical protein